MNHNETVARAEALVEVVNRNEVSPKRRLKGFEVYPDHVLFHTEAGKDLKMSIEKLYEIVQPLEGNK